MQVSEVTAKPATTKNTHEHRFSGPASGQGFMRRNSVAPKAGHSCCCGRGATLIGSLHSFCTARHTSRTCWGRCCCCLQQCTPCVANGSNILEISKTVSVEARCKKSCPASGQVSTHVMAAALVNNLTDAFICACQIQVNLLHSSAPLKLDRNTQSWIKQKRSTGCRLRK